MQEPIVENLASAGLEKDCPFQPSAEGEARFLPSETAREVDDAAFAEFVGRVNAYLQASPYHL